MDMTRTITHITCIWHQEREPLHLSYASDIQKENRYNYQVRVTSRKGAIRPISCLWHERRDMLHISLASWKTHPTKHWALGRRQSNAGHQLSYLMFNLYHAAGDFCWQNLKNNFFQCRYILMPQTDSSSQGNTFKKLKHCSIIIGCWNIHWNRKCTLQRILQHIISQHAKG